MPENRNMDALFTGDGIRLSPDGTPELLSDGIATDDKQFFIARYQYVMCGFRTNADGRWEWFQEVQDA